MQATERENEIEGVPQAGPQSQPLTPVSLVTVDDTDDDPEEIFLNAVAEIDTQPLVKSTSRKTGTFTIADVLEIGFLVCVLCFGLFGSAYLAITYPHTLVIVYAKARPASITATLDVPTRTLAPITITRSVTAPTTGHGHQEAQAATGILTFYNGNANPQTVPRGTVFTGADSLQVSTDQSITIPAAQPPSFGQATIPATTIRAGATSNIHSFDINGTVSSSLFVKNLQAFTGGRDARTYKAVGQSDVDSLTSTVQQTLATAFTTAFPVRPGEQAQPTNCHTTTTADHGLGQEAQTVTVKTSKICSAIAYSQDELTREATAAFTQTQPAATYHLVGSVQTTVQSVSPVSVTINGKWAYTFSPDYQELLAHSIEGDSPAKARKVLLQTGVISYANIPSTLPPAMYINFLVLVG